MIRLSIPDMSCRHCIDAVTRAVKLADPEASVTIDLGKRTAAIDTKRPPSVIAKAIEQAGYSSSPLPREAS